MTQRHGARELKYNGTEKIERRESEGSGERENKGSEIEYEMRILWL